MSRTFSTNCGSVESLKVSVLCGCSENAVQMRCTEEVDNRVWPAICRILQCVPSCGSSPVFYAPTGLLVLADRSRAAWAQFVMQPGTSCSKNRRRHLPTVALVSPIWRAICWFVLPAHSAK